MKFRMCLVWMILAAPFAISCRGQDFEHDILSRIGGDAAAILVSTDLERLVDHFDVLQLSESKHWKNAMHALGAGVLDEESMPSLSLEKLEESLPELRELLKSCDEIVVVVHGIPSGSSPVVSLLLRSRPKVLESLESILVPIVDGGQKSNDDGKKQDKKTVKGIHFEMGSGWLQISNAKSGIVDFMGSTRGVTFASSRRFKRVYSHFSNRKVGTPILYGVGNPCKFNSFFPSIDAEYWDALGVNNLPSFGMAFFLKDGRNKVQKSSIVGEFYVTMTHPSSGLTRYIASHEEIGEMPGLGHMPSKMTVAAFDPILRDQAEEEIFKKRWPDKSYLESKVPKYPHDEKDRLDHLADVVPRTGLRLQAMFHIDEQGLNDVLTIESVRDHESMNRYITKVIAVTNSFRASSEKIELHDFGLGNEVWAERNRSVKRNSQVYFHGENWYISGSEKIFRMSFLPILNESKEETSQIYKLIKSVDEEIKPISPPCRIDYLSPTHFRNIAGYLEANRIIEKCKKAGSSVDDALGQKEDEFGNTLRIEGLMDRQVLFRKHLILLFAEKYGQLMFISSCDGDRFQIRFGSFSENSVGDELEK